MNIGVVIIGRNEGERLHKCLKSVSDSAHNVVYVDSGSTDDSVNLAQSMKSEVLALDMTIPFTAARARNEGGKLLHKLFPDLDYIQFVDGDCELANGWLEAASSFLDQNQNIVMVCGRLRERYPEHSIYNQLLDIEWNTETGLAKSCGGIAMVRAAAFHTSGGFRTDLIAGEESELCLRLRAAGWQVWRLDTEMALHDAAMKYFWQWWKRTVRSGYAYAEGAHLHGASPEQHRLKETRRIWVWGLLIPLMAICMSFCLSSWALLLLLAYPVQIMRLTLRGTHSGKLNFLRALFLVIGKFPEVIGQLKFIYNRLAGKSARLIEYK